MSTKSFKISFHHLRARFYQYFNSIYVKSHNFTEPVLLAYFWLTHTASHIYCMVLKLLIGPLLNCPVWTMPIFYNSVLCRLYKISFNSVDVIYAFSNLRIKSEIELRTRTFLKPVWMYRQCDCTWHVFSVGRVTCVFLCFLYSVFLSTVLYIGISVCCYHVYWWNKERERERLIGQIITAVKQVWSPKVDKHETNVPNLRTTLLTRPIGPGTLPYN